MIRVASVNLHKRFDSERSKIVRWLESQKIEILFAQEPTRKQKVLALSVPDLKPLRFELLTDYCQRVSLGYFTIYNLYLDAYKRSTRASQLNFLEIMVKKDKDTPVIILGDFNIAPHPSDGLFGGTESKFNCEVDRQPLQSLLETCHLVDRGSNIGSEYTLEKIRGDKLLQFRCDLALVSSYVADQIALHYDHSVRLSNSSFTDHSALILDLPVHLSPGEQLKLIAHPGANVFKPEQTAIHRSGPSPFARQLVKKIGNRSILDYGCGYGEDVNFYRKNGIRAEGFDPHKSFNWSKEPKGWFPIITLLYVLNILPNPKTRLQVLREALSHLSSRGQLIVVTRTPKEIDSAGKKHRWEPFSDGYWSQKNKSTFQHGLGKTEILGLAKRLDLEEVHPMNRLFSKFKGNWTLLELQKSDFKISNESAFDGVFFKNTLNLSNLKSASVSSGMKISGVAGPSRRLGKDEMPRVKQSGTRGQITKLIVVKALIRLYEKKLSSFGAAKEQAIKASEDAPSRNEARYDTSKDDFARAAATISESIKETENSLAYLALLLADENKAKLIEVVTGETSAWYLVSDSLGGERVKVGDQEVMAISTKSPLGNRLWEQ